MKVRKADRVEVKGYAGKFVVVSVEETNRVFRGKPVLNFRVRPSFYANEVSREFDVLGESNLTLAGTAVK